MKRCPVCQRRVVLSSLRDGEQHYCSLPCYTRSEKPGFCQACLDSTEDKSPGGTYTLNGIGTQLSFARQRCPTCHSVVQTKFFCLVFLPLIPLGRYRLIYVQPGRYVGRRLSRSRELHSTMPINPR